ncbi:hypothetical protein [Sphingobacterium nematocida]|uniref:hypothetical protein n=1 Tax=Sphingobacterium nematocida TaxID=1513896 RepID=UPI001117748A|nr:hypothetical protein [Sphingobacterium nematocida]
MNAKVHFLSRRKRLSGFFKDNKLSIYREVAVEKAVMASSPSFGGDVFNWNNGKDKLLWINLW